MIPIERCKRQQQLHVRRDGYVFGIGANELHPALSPIPPELYGTDWIVDQCKDPQAMRRRNYLGWTSAGRSLEWGGGV